MDRYNFDYNDWSQKATHRVEFEHKSGISVSIPACFDNGQDCINAALADKDNIEFHHPGVLIVEKYGELQLNGLYELKKIYSQTI